MQHLPGNLGVELERGLGLETNAGSHKVLDCSSLLAESVDDRSILLDQGSLEHVAEQGHDRIDVVKVLAIGRVLDSGHQLAQDGKIKDDGSSQQRVLAEIVDGQDVATAHHDLRDILERSSASEITPSFADGLTSSMALLESPTVFMYLMTI